MSIPFLDLNDHLWNIAARALKSSLKTRFHLACKMSVQPMSYTYSQPTYGSAVPMVQTYSQQPTYQTYNTVQYTQPAPTQYVTQQVAAPVMQTRAIAMSPPPAPAPAPIKMPGGFVPKTEVRSSFNIHFSPLLRLAPLAC